MLDALYVVAGLVLLVTGGNWLLKGAVDLSARLMIPRIIIGMTVVSFATSAPELIVSLRAALQGFPDLALGNVVGSNSANLGLVLAITLLIGHINIGRSFYFTDWPVLMLSSLVVYFFLANDGLLDRGEAGVLLVMLLLFLIYLLRFQKPAETEEASQQAVELFPPMKTAFYIGAGGAALWGGSELLIHGAVNLATALGISERIIGITLVSVGTSIPELAAAVIAMVKKEKAISVGTLLGSNIFNLLAVLGLIALIRPIPIHDMQLVNHDFLWMLAISFIILPLVALPKARQLGLRSGLVLLSLYAAFMIISFN